MTVSEERIEEHFGLVNFIINRHFNSYINSRKVEYDDLFQVGCMYLLQAIRKYDASKECTFSTFATTQIWGGIQNHLNRDNNRVGVSRVVFRLAAKIRSMGLANSPIEEIASKLGCSPRRAERAKEFAHTAVLSMDATIAIDDSEVTFHDFLTDRDDLTGLHVQEFISTLSERDQKIVMLRLNYGLTQQEIANQIGTNQVQVGRALRKIGSAYLDYLGSEVSA